MGLIFVGIDVIDGYLTEINVTSPTGLRAIRRIWRTGRCGRNMGRDRGKEDPTVTVFPLRRILSRANFRSGIDQLMPLCNSARNCATDELVREASNG